MIYLWSFLFGAAIGGVGFLAALTAKKHPETPLFGKTVETERVMDVVFLLFVAAVEVMRLVLLPSGSELGVTTSVLTTLVTAATAVVIIWLGYRLVIRKKFKK